MFNIEIIIIIILTESVDGTSMKLGFHLPSIIIISIPHYNYKEWQTFRQNDQIIKIPMIIM